MSSFVTVSRKDNEFWSLLTGRFSKTHFAKPVKNLYVNSSEETVTFKIVEREQLSLWKSLYQWYSLARNIYLLFPILGGVSFLSYQYGKVPLDILCFSGLSLQSFLMAITLFNDYHDYIHGVDRVSENSSKKPLVQGLIRPYQAHQLAYVFLGVSSLLAGYCFVYNPMSLIFAAVAFVIASLTALPIVSKKYKGLSSFMSFTLAGPLLVLGYEYLFFQTLSLNSTLLGFVFGLHALKYDFCKQVQNIFYSSKAQLVTVSGFLGFERSKYLYSFLSLSHIALLTLFVSFSGQMNMSILIIVALGFEFYINRLFLRASSFLSSDLENCIGLQKLHYCIEGSLIMFISLSPLWLS